MKFILCLQLKEWSFSFFFCTVFCPIENEKKKKRVVVLWVKRGI